ncbi:MAG TPA: hypothetical protein VLH61_04570 [Bacteroidales bacterium]|nr:hypothetical protein [Bacteroidales bacterium]
MPYSSNIRKKISRHLVNIPGWCTSRKPIVFLSDDWGGVRVRSKEAREALIRAGLPMDRNRFDRFDCLESNGDLEGLFEVLLSHKDQNGNHPVITAVANVANPDFEKIREGGFSEYHYEPFTETLKRYPEHNSVFELYQKGIALNVFRPELHGREHLQVQWWLENLQSGHEAVRLAFEQGFWHLPGKYLTNPLHRGLAAAYDIASTEEVDPQKGIVADGAVLFNQIFGYNSELFIPPAQHYNQSLEQAIAAAGFKMIDVPRLRKMPLGDGKFKIKLHFPGQQNKSGLQYITRNAVFEPNMNEHSDGVNECLADIESAFCFKKPAIISNHRAAFTGGLDEKNQAKGLKALNRLLREILKRWPNAEFISAPRLFEIMNGK